VNRLLPTLEALLTESGLEVRRIQVADGFARLLVSSEVETTTVDLTWDARRFPLEQTENGAILADEELAADKLLALFGRAAARDFVDVAALAPGMGSNAFASWPPKRTRFRPISPRRLLRSFDRLPRADFEVDDSEFSLLRTFGQELASTSRD
jgi:hypothetical protein